MSGELLERIMFPIFGKIIKTTWPYDLNLNVSILKSFLFTEFFERNKLAVFPVDRT